MSAGDTSTSKYSKKLASIDWSALYGEEKGYLFFEDLKHQWKEGEGLDFDYVLVDSRTGHTDVGGICTRQLPDLVVAMFLSTMQNISGLAPIVREIRRDKSRQMRPVETLFCASNVPDLDDERSILSSLLDRAAEELSFDPKRMKMVHHYASLDVLSHTIFTMHRPNSKLSKEYAELEKSIISHNHVDPDGALLALKDILLKVRLSSHRPKAIEREGVAESVDRIFSFHPSNTEIARVVSQIRSMIGDIEGEIDALTAAIEGGDDSISLRGMRARAYQAIGLKERSESDLRYIIENEDASGVDTTTALQMLRRTDHNFDDTISSLLRRRALSLSVLNSLAEFVLTDRWHLSNFADRLRLVVDEGEGTTRELSSAKVNLVLALIGSGRFKEAVANLDARGSAESDDVPEMFNLLIARWAAEGLPDTSLAEDILAQMLVSANRTDANFLQCTAVLKAIVGERDSACSLLERAIETAHQQKGKIFSCATYLNRTSEEFVADCRGLKERICRDGVVELQLGEAKPTVSI